MILVRCPSCQQPARVADEARGRAVRCGGCGKAMMTPPAPDLPEAASQPGVTAPPAPTALIPTPNISSTESWPDVPPPAPASRRRPVLGQPVREFGPPRGRPGFLLPAGLLGIGFGSAALLARSGELAGAALLLAVTAAGAVASLALGRGRTSGGRITLCEGGLLWGPEGGAVSCAWEEVESVLYRKDGHPSAAARLVLVRRDGREFDLPRTAERPAEVLRAVNDYLRPLLVPQALAALEGDDGAPFGPLLRLQAWGLEWFETPICWADLDAVVCGFHARSRCAVLAAESRLNLPALDLGAVANAGLLLELLRDRFGVRVECAAALTGAVA